jgi:hypothetical protein
MPPLWLRRPLPLAPFSPLAEARPLMAAAADSCHDGTSATGGSSTDGVTRAHLVSGVSGA